MAIDPQNNFSPGDDETVILRKILDRISSSGSLGSNFVLKTGDTMTGALAFNRGTLVASSPSINISSTWNSGATVFTSVLLNVTNTASSTDSLLYDFQVNGESRANFSIDGVARFIRHMADEAGTTFFLRKRGRTGDINGAIANDGGIGNFLFSGWDGSANFNTAAIIVNAEEAWTGLVGGSRMAFQVTTPGTRTNVNAMILRSGSLDLPAGSALKLVAGTNARAGNAILLGGTKAVANTTVTANTVIILTRKSAGGVIGDLTYTLNAGVGFTINSASGIDTSTVSYLLIET